MVDRLINKIEETKCPVCVGLDTRVEYLPEDFVSARTAFAPLTYAAENIYRYNCMLIDAFADIAPCVKVQSAYYEMYGDAGVLAFKDTLNYAKKSGMIAIADVKRNDIGETAKAYSAAYLGRTDVLGEDAAAFDADFITVNAYLGSDGILPFIEDCKKYKKGIFVLVKTSNKSSGEFQDLMVDGGVPLYEKMASMVDKWGSSLRGRYGYSSVGAVVGATYPEQAAKIREAHPNLFVLVPGYGAQGATAEDIAPNFGRDKRGGIVNNSRSILTAHMNPQYSHLPFDEAARQAVIDMRDDIMRALKG